MTLCRTCENWTAIMCQGCLGELEARAEQAEAECVKWHLKACHRGEELSRLRAALRELVVGYDGRDPGLSGHILARHGIDLESLTDKEG